LIVHACIYLLAGGALSGFLFGIGWVLTLLLQGEAMAAQFTTAWLSTFSGILVGASGYGLLFFVARERHRLGLALLNVFDVPVECQPDFMHRLSLIRAWSLRSYVTALLTLIGGIVLVRAGIPLKGFAHWYLTAAVVSYYLIGAYMLMIFVAILGIFVYVDEHSMPGAAHRFSLRPPLRSIEIKTIDAYLIISSLLGLLAVYHAFRTTLIAFADAPRPYYELMVLPLFFFVPATLIFSFYPRYVLREVWDADTYVLLERIAPDSWLDGNNDPKALLELRKLLMEVKAKAAEERKSVPLLTLKDAPALTLAAFTVIQFVVQKDPVLVNFFKSIFKM
jgi:hypothetical protein